MREAVDCNCLQMRMNILFWSVSCARQGFISGVDPGLSGLDGAGNQEDCVLARVVLPVEGHALRQKDY